MSNLHQRPSGFVQYISFAELIAWAISVHALLCLLPQRLKCSKMKVPLHSFFNDFET